MAMNGECFTPETKGLPNGPSVCMLLSGKIECEIK